jgi:hypothetical protein
MYRIKEENTTTEGVIPQHNNQRRFIPGGRGGFGREGRGLITYYNCNQLGHLAHDYLNPCTTYTYCRELDHETKDCPQLLAKWQERCNKN